MKKVTLYLGSNCNLNCTYCHRECGEEPKFDANTLISLAEKLTKIAKREDLEIKFMGGEPLLYIGCISYIVKNVPAKKFTVSTNGTLLKKYRDFLESHKIYVILSYDGTDNNRDLRSYDPFTEVIDYPYFGGVSCTLYRGNTNLKRIYKNFMEKEDLVGRPLPFYPHIMHTTNEQNTPYSLTYGDYCSIFHQEKAILDEFLRFFKATGKTLRVYTPLYNWLLKRYKANYEWGETYCVNKQNVKMDIFGREYTCHYMRDTKAKDLKKVMEESFSSCKNCRVYKMCGGACIKSKRHGLECMYYKKLFTWFKSWYEENEEVLSKIPVLQVPEGSKNGKYRIYHLVQPFLHNKLKKVEFKKNFLGYDIAIITVYNKYISDVDLLVELSNIPLGESALVTYNTESKKFNTIYGVKEYLQSVDKTPSEYSRDAKEQFILQVNRMVNDKYFIKSYSSEEVDNFTFSVEGEFLLYQKMKSVFDIQVLDRFYTFYTLPCGIKIDKGYITTKWIVTISSNYPKPLYVNYGKISTKVREGFVTLTFPYKKGESFYWGDKYTKYKGREFSIEEGD